MDNDQASSNSSLLHKSKLCFSCCFRRRSHHHCRLPIHSPPPEDIPAASWSKTRGLNHVSLSDFAEKCRPLLGLPCSRHKRHASAEFKYDASSYALNFENGFHCGDDDAPLRNFSARLPPSPPCAAKIFFLNL